MSATRPLWTARILAVLPFVLFAALVVFALLQRSFDTVPPFPRFQRFAMVGLTVCIFYAAPVNLAFGLLGLSDPIPGIAYFAAVFAYSCALSHVLYRWGKKARRPDEIFGSMFVPLLIASTAGILVFGWIAMEYENTPSDPQKTIGYFFIGAYSGLVAAAVFGSGALIALFRQTHRLILLLPASICAVTAF